MLAVPAMALDIDGDVPDPTPGDDQVRLLYIMAKVPREYHYNVGETFDMGDTCIIAYYNSKDWNSFLEKDITAEVAAQLNGIHFDTPGSQELYFTYTEDGITAESCLYIKVNDPNSSEPRLQSLHFNNWPFRTYIGDGLDLSNLKAIATYRDKYDNRTEIDVTEEFLAQIAQQGVTQGMVFDSEDRFVFPIVFNKDGQQISTRIHFDIYERN